MTNIPSVSVVVPVFNGEKYISAAIQSVIEQTESGWELLVVDDGSTDSTLKIISEFARNDARIHVLTHVGGKNCGVSRSRKLGLDHARGEFIAHLDADDIFKPDKIKRQLEIMKEFKHCVLCHTSVLAIDSNGTVDHQPIPWFMLDNGRNGIYNLLSEKKFMKQNKICNSTVMYKKSIAKDLKFDSLQLFQYEDWLEWLMMSEKGVFYFLNEPLVFYRLHDESSTSKVVNNDLIRHYSHMELYLSIITKTENSKTLNNAAMEILNVLDNLMLTYCNNNKFNRVKIYYNILFCLLEKAFLRCFNLKKILFLFRL